MQQFRYLWLCLLPAAFVACRKADLQPFVEDQIVYFYQARISPQHADSITYSFAVRPDALQTDTVRIPIRITGMAMPADRPVTYAAIAGSSSIAPESYELLPAVVKAGEYSGEIMIKVKRSPDMKSRESRLAIRLVNSADFKASLDGQSEYLVKVNDFLTRPASWLEYQFGKYSAVKYDLIIKATGKYDYSGVLTTESEYLRQVAINYLIAWEAANGPLLDENGERIFFP